MKGKNTLNDVVQEPFMEYLGDVETITHDGRIVVRAVSTPDVNNAVFDSHEHKIGTVKRVFGPVDSPYVTILPVTKGDLSGLLNKKTYLKGEKRDGKGKGRRGRD